jgi:predicted small lipoprotein YifL
MSARLAAVLLLCALAAGCGRKGPLEPPAAAAPPPRTEARPPTSEVSPQSPDARPTEVPPADPPAP